MWQTLTAAQAQGPPASQLPPRLLACLLCSLEVHLLLRPGDFSGSVHGLPHFLYSEARELDSCVVCILLCYSLGQQHTQLPRGDWRGGRAWWEAGWGPRKFQGERHWGVFEHDILPCADKEVNTERLSDPAEVDQQVGGGAIKPKSLPPAA